MIKLNFTNSRWERYVMYLIVGLSLFTTKPMEAQCSLACNSNIQVSVDQFCSAVFDPSTLLNGEMTSCPGGVFELILNDPHTGAPFWTGPLPIGGSDPIDLYDYLFKSVQFEVRETASGQSCWGNMFIEDKLGPIIECPDDIPLVCCLDTENILPPDITITENCSHVVDTILLSETIIKNECDGTFPDNVIKELTRVVTTVDSYGNQSALCTLKVQVERLDFANDLKCPPQYRVENDVVETDLFLDYTNWTENVNGQNGMITAAFPASIEILAQSDGPSGTNITTEVCYTATGDKYLSFDWSATHPAGNWTNDEPGFSIDGVVTNLYTGNSGELAVSGAETVFVSAGETFCFLVNSPNRGVETTAIFSNFGCKDLDQPELVCDRGYTWYKDSKGNINPASLLPGSFLDANSDGIPDPVTCNLGGTGVPGICKDGKVIDLYPQTDLLCNVLVEYRDVVLPEIKCVTKIVRTWTIREWHCSAEIDTVCVQFIEVVDNQGPDVVVPHDFEASTNGYTCEANVWIPPFAVTDNCNTISHVDLKYPGGFQSDFDWTTGSYLTLPVGVDTIEILSYDACHNLSLDTFYINVSDNTPPVAICDDHTVISLTYDGEAHVPASVFDDGSYDDCGIKKMLVRRMVPGCDCENHYPKFDDMHYIGSFDSDGDGTPNHYYLSDKELYGHKAYQMAEAMGGYVAVINSEDEDEWIYDNVFPLLDAWEPLNRDKRYWIGYSDANHEDNFEWTNGEPTTYTNWMPGMGPGFPRDLQDYVAVDATGDWRDVNGLRREHRYIFEVEDPCGFSAYANFCCEDLTNNNHMVVFRVVDKWGNYNDCMVEAEIQDKFPPQIVCPPDLTVECEYVFDINDLSVFGTVVKGAENRGVIDIYGDYLIAPEGQLWDGYAHDNCNVEIIECPVDDQRNQCGIGTVVRTWKAYTPGAQDTATCWQYITFPPSHYEVLDFMDMPYDTTFTDGCDDPDNYHPDVTGWPTFPDTTSCRLIGTSWEDHTFPFNQQTDNACFKIIRKWKVIDWCLPDTRTYIDAETGLLSYYPGSTHNPITYTQVIKVQNTIDPVLSGNCDPVSVCTYDPQCEGGYIDLTMSATDDCTLPENLRWEYHIDAFSDGVYDILNAGIGGTADASGEYPVGDHLIVWVFEDMCGNPVTCTQPFTIKNCKAPTPYCIDGLAVDLMAMDTTGDGTIDIGMVELWASDFDQGSSHACGYPVWVSFSADVTEKNMTFTCDNVGDNEIEIWTTVIIPGGGRIDTIQSYCTTNLNVQDNMNACGSGQGGGATDDTEARIAGIVSTSNAATVEGVNVSLIGSEFNDASTDASGSYAFPTMITGGNYTVMPGKSDDPMNGVSTLDIVLIQQHILGLNNLSNPYDMIAADINMDAMISASDIIELRKLILGVTMDFDTNESWRFVNSQYQFANPSNPLVENFDESYVVNDFQNDMDVDFTAIKVGDVNNTVVLNGANSVDNRSNKNLVLSIDKTVMEANDMVQIPFTSASDELLLGYQFTLEFDNNTLEFQGIEAGVMDITESNVGLTRLDEGKITFSWGNATAVQVNTNDVMFALNFKATSTTSVENTLSISSTVTSAEAYTDGEIMGVELDYRDGIAIGTSFKLYQNTPNPFSESTVIGFELPQAGLATLNITNVTGQLVKTITRNFERGYNSVKLDNSDFMDSGILLYSLEANGENATKRMVVLK